MAGPNDNNTPKPEEQQAGGMIDPITLRLSGMTEQDAKAGGYIVAPMTVEDSWEVNKDALNGMPMSDFVNFHKSIYGEDLYDAVKQSDHNAESDPDWEFLSGEAERVAGMKPGYAINAHPSSYGLTPEQSVGWEIPDNTKSQGQLGKAYTTKGKRTTTLRSEELMDSKRQYYRPKTDDYGSLEDYQMANLSGSPFRTDENGNSFMLVKDHNNDQWVEVPATDVVDGKQARSMFGPQKRTSGVWGHAYDMAQNTMMDVMYSQWGTAAEMGGSFVQWLGGGEDLNSWQKYGRQLQNYGNASKSKVSEVAENEGLFDSWRGFAGTTSGILTQIGAQALVGIATRGIGSAIAGTGKVAQAAKWAIEGSPYVFGGIFAANAMNEEAKAAGLNDTDRQLLALGAFATVMASEYATAKALGATGIADGFRSKGSQEAVEKLMRENFGKVINEAKDVFLDKTATVAAKQAATKSILGKIVSGARTATGKAAGGASGALGLIQKGMSIPIQMGYSKAPGSFWGRARGALASGWEEGWEEVFEGQMNTFMKNMYNEGAIGWYGPEDGAVAGKGKFQHTNFSLNLEEFVGGMIGGGVMGGIMGGRLKRDFSDNAIAEMAMQYDTFEEADKALAAQHERGAFGSPILSTNDQFLSALPEGERAKAKSKNDAAFQVLREELRTAFQLKGALNLTSAEQVNKVMGGDMTLVKNTLTTALAAKKLEKQLAKDKAEFDAIQDKTSSEAQALSKKIADGEAELARAKKMTDKALDGSMIQEYKAHMLTRAMLVNNSFGEAMMDAMMEEDKDLRKAKMQGLIDDSISLAEKRDLWDDSEKAMTMVRDAKSYADKYKAIQAEMAKKREESKAASAIFNSTFANIDIEDETQLDALRDAINEGHFVDDYIKTIDSVLERIANRRKELGEEVDKDIMDAAENAAAVEMFGADNFYDEDGDGYMSALDADPVRNAELKDKMRKAAKKNEDKIKTMRALDARKEEIGDKTKNLKKADAKNSVVFAGDVDRSSGQKTYLDSVKDGEVAAEDLYMMTNESGQASEITQADYDKAKADAGATTDSFEHNGIKYAKEAGNYTTVTGDVLEDGEVKKKSQKHAFANVDNAMAVMLREGEQLAGTELRTALMDILYEYNASGQMTSPEMKEKLAAIKKRLDQKDQLFDMVDYLLLMDKNGLLTEPQIAYFGLDGYKAMGGGYDVLKKKHETDKTIYTNVNTTLMSKEERESNMAKLKDATLRMFAAVHNKLLDFVGVEDVTVDGVVLQVPEAILAGKADEVKVMQAMQYWHHYMKQIGSDKGLTDKFVEEFRLFWHNHVQHDMSEGAKLLPTNRDSYTFEKASKQGMFLESFETMLSEEAFESGKTSEANNSYRELFMYHTMNMMMQMDPSVYYGSMLSMLDAVADPNTFDLTKPGVKYKGDHTAEQLLNVMIGMAHIEEGITRNSAATDPNYLFLMDSVKTTMKLGTSADSSKDAKSLYRPLTKKDGSGIKYDMSNPKDTGAHIRDNYLMVPGSAGVGKTTFFIKTMVEHALSRGYKKFVLVAPNKDQLKAMEAAIPKGVDKSMFTIKTIEDFIVDQHLHRDSVIFVDELSLLTDQERNTLYFNGVLSSIGSKEITTLNPEQIDDSNTVFMLGDEYQAPYSVEEYNKSNKLSEWMQHGFNMTAVKRSSFVDIFKIQNIFRSQSARQKAIIPTLIEMSYSDEGGVRKGVKLNSDLTSFMAEAKEAVLAKRGYIIVYDQDTFNDITKDMPAEVHDRVFYMTKKSKSPQGQSLAGEVYVYLPPNKVQPQVGDARMFNRYMLTAVSRATTYVSVFTGAGLGNTNSKKVDSKSLAVFEDKALEVSKRKKALYDGMADVFGKLPKIGTAKGFEAPIEEKKADSEAKEEKKAEDVSKEPTDDEEAEAEEEGEDSDADTGPKIPFEDKPVVGGGGGNSAASVLQATKGKPVTGTLNNGVYYSNVAKEEKSEDAIYVDENKGVYLVSDGMGGETSRSPFGPADAGKFAIQYMLNGVQGVEKELNAILDIIKTKYKAFTDKKITQEEYFNFVSNLLFGKDKKDLLSHASNLVNDIALGDFSKRIGATFVGAKKIGPNTFEVTQVGDAVYVVVDKDGKIMRSVGLSNIAATEGIMIKFGKNFGFTIDEGKDLQTTTTVTLKEGERLILSSDWMETEDAVKDFIASDFGKTIDYSKHKYDDRSFIVIPFSGPKTLTRAEMKAGIKDAYPVKKGKTITITHKGEVIKGKVLSLEDQYNRAEDKFSISVLIEESGRETPTTAVLITSNNAGDIEVKVISRGKERAKTKTITEIKEEVEVDNSTDESSLAEEEVPDYGKPAQGMVWGKASADPADTAYNTIVTPEGLVIQVGATYLTGDTVPAQAMVKSIQKDSDGNYMILTDRDKRPMSITLFTKSYGRTQELVESSKQKALDVLVNEKKATFFGKTMPAYMLTSLKEGENKAAYNERVKGIIQKYKAMPAKVGVTVMVQKNVPTVDYNGKISEPRPFVLDIFIDGEYFGSHYVTKKADNIKSSAEATYNAMLHDYLSSVVGDRSESMQLFDEPIMLSKGDILPNSFFDIAETKGSMAISEIQQVVNEYGLFMSPMYQEQSRDASGKVQAGVDTVVYVSSEEVPSPTNGKRIILESIQAKEMTPEQMTKFENYVLDMQMMVGNLDLQNEGARNLFLEITDQLFEFNRSSLKGAMMPKYRDTVAATDASVKARLRKEALQELAKQLGAKNAKGSLSFMRMPTSLAEGKTGELKSENMDFIRSKAEVFPRIPVVRVPFHEMFGMSGLAAQIEAADELSDYDTAWKEAEGILKDILGVDVSMGMIRSDRLHGFVTKAGKILMNYREGMTNSKKLYHEIAHYVAEFLLTDEALDKLYTEVANKYGIKNWKTDPKARRDVAERLAEDAERYNSERRNLKGISKYLQQFLDWLSRVFSKLGIIKSTIRDFNYDVYIAKKYKAADGKSLPMLREEMPFDSLFAKVEQKSFNQVSNEYFYDNEVARTVARTVGSIIAIETILPSQNSRLYQDEDTSFTDMVNRVEYFMRSRVMFKTKGDYGQYEYQEVELDGKKFNLPAMRNIMVNGQQMFKWAYNTKDEKGQTISGLSLQYYDADISGYRSVVANSKGVYFLEKRDRQRIRTMMRKAMLGHEVLTSEGMVPILSLDKADIDKLKHIKNKEDRELYKYAMTLYDDVLVATMSRYFPTLDIRDMLNKGAKIKFSDIAEALVRVQDANIRKEASEVNHMDRQSDIMKLILNTTPKATITSSGEVIQGTGFVDYVIANKLMTDLTMNLYNGAKGDSIKQFADAMKRKLTAYREIKGGTDEALAAETLRQDRDYINLASVYKTFFDPQGYVNGMNEYQASHYRIVQWFRELSKLDKNSPEYKTKLNQYYNDYKQSFATQKRLGQMAQGDEVMTIEKFDADLINRAKNSERVLTAIVTHFGSISTNKFTTIKQYGQKEKAKFYSHATQTGSTEDQAKRLEDEILLNMYSGDGTVADRFKDMFIHGLSPIKSKGDTPNNANFYMTDRGIMYYKTGKNSKSDTGVVLIPIEKNSQGKYALRGLTDAEIAEIARYAREEGTTKFNIIKKVFTDFLNKSDVDGAVVRMLTNKKVGTDRFGIESLHTLFGPMIASMYTHTIDRTLLDTSTEPMYEVYMEVLDSYAAQSGMGDDYGKTTDSQRDAMMDPDAGSVIQAEGKAYYFPTGFYKELSDLASMFAVRDYNPTVQDVSGRRKIYVVGVQSNMGYKLAGGTNDALVELYAEKVKDGHANMNSRGGMVLNPMLGRKGFIVGTNVMMGIKGTSNSADLKNMTPQDNYYAAMADFTKYFNRDAGSFALTSLPIPFMNQGHRGQQMSAMMNFNIIGGKSNGMLKKVGDTYVPDYENFLEHIRRGFAIKEEAQVHSLNRWVSYLSNPAYREYTGSAAMEFNTSMLIDTEAPGWKLQRDMVLAKVTAFIKIFGTEIIDTDVPAFDGSGLMSGIDYLILKKGKGDDAGRLYLGYDTNMMGDVYTTVDTGGKRRTTSEKVFNRYKYDKMWDVELADGTIVAVPTHELISTGSMGTTPYIMVTNKKGQTERVPIAGKIAQDVVQYMFQQQHAETNRIAKENGYVMTEDNVPGVPKNWTGKGIMVNGKMNPVWEAFNMAHTMLNYYFDHGLEGTQAMHLSPVLYENEEGAITYGQNRNKRALSHSSTGMTPSAGSYFGIDPETRIMTIRDLKTRAKIETIMGTIDKEHTVFDGQSLNNPFYLLMYYESMGATNGSMNISGGVKSVGMMTNYRIGRMTMKKHAADTFSKTMLDSSSDAAKLFEIMLNPQSKAVIRNASATLRFKGDIDAMANDNLYQRYLIYLDNTGTQIGVDNTIARINKAYGSIENMISKVIKKPELAMSTTKDWQALQNDGLPMGKYLFLQELLKQVGTPEMLAPEGDVDHYAALKELHHFYADARAKGKGGKYKYLSAILFSQDKKEQARGFEMPYVPYNQGMGATHRDATGEFTSGRAMRMFGTPSSPAPTSLYELHDQWGQVSEDAPFELWTEMFDNTQEVTQLNPNREIDDNEESPMVQAMSIVLANPKSLDSGLAKGMANDLAELMRTGMENMMRYITNDGKFDEDGEAKIQSLKIDTEVGLSASEKLKIEQYVKGKIKKSMSSTDDSTMLSVIINDDEISINVSPGAVTRVVQYLSAFLKKEAIKRKVEAMRLVQFGGNFIELMAHKETGEVFMKGEAIKHANKMGVDVQELFEVTAPRTLKHTTITPVDKELTLDQQAYIDSINTNEQQALSMAPDAKTQKAIAKMYSKIRMQYMVKQGLAVVSRGEAVVPAVKFKKYDIPSSVGMNELFRIYYKEGETTKELNLRALAQDYTALRAAIAGFVKDNITANISYSKGDKKPRISFGYGDNMLPGMNKYFDILFLDGANAYMDEKYQTMSKLANDVDKALHEKHGDLFDDYISGAMSDEGIATIRQESRAMTTDKVALYADDFIQAQVDKMAKGLRAVVISSDANIGMRTPSGPGSGFVNDIVGFINDNGAVGYINTIKNLIDGSDQDVDQFTMYFTADTMVDTGVMTEEEYATWRDEQLRKGNYDAVTDEEGNRINNKLLAKLKEYYLNAENTDFTMAAIDTDPVKKAADGTYAKMFPSGDASYNFGQSMAYREIAMDGMAVGPFALSQKLQTLLYSGYHANGRRGIDSTYYPFNIGAESNGDTEMMYDKVPIYMEMMINAATDNPKLLALGAMNLSMVNADMASAMMFASQEIVDYMRNKTGNPAMTEVDAVLEFLKSDANANIFRFVKDKSNMVNGGFMPSYYSAAHTYYNNLSKNYDANVATLSQLQKDVASAQNAIRLLLNEVAGVTDEEINIAIQQGDSFDSLLTYLSRKAIAGVKKEVKHQHMKLKKIINAELEGRITGEQDDAIIDSIKDAMRSPLLDEAYGLLNELGEGEVSNLSQMALAESKELSKKWATLVKEIRKYKQIVKDIKYNARITDTEGYMKEVYMVSKYAMLGEVMRNLTKVANINQFQVGSPYEVDSFAKQLKYSTGYDMDNMIAIYDEYVAWKKETDNPDATIAAFFDEHPTYRKSIEEVQAAAFDTQRHTMAQKDYKWMIDPITSPDGTETTTFIDDFHNIFNFAEIVLSRPDIMESIRAVQLMRDTSDAMFSVRHPDLVRMQREIQNEAGYDLWNEEKFNTYYEEVNRYFMHLFMSQHSDNIVEMYGNYHDALAFYGAYDMPMYSVGNAGMVPTTYTPDGIRTFISTFPGFFRDTVMPKIVEQLKEIDPTMENSELATNFLERIELTTYNSMEFIDVKRSRIQTPDEIQNLREGFNALPKEARTLLAFYQMLKDGFEYNKSFFGQVMPKEYLKYYTNFLTEELPDMTMGEHLENLKLQILSNPSLGLLRKETYLKKGDEWISMPPSSADGVPRFYYKTVQVQKRKGYSAVRTMALAETTAIQGTHLVRGEATRETDKVVPFDTIINLDKDLTNKAYTVQLAGKTYDINLKPIAYIRWFIHGHAEAELTKAVQAEYKATGVDVSPERVMALADAIMNRDLNREVYRLKGIPAIGKADVAEANKKVIQSKVLELMKALLTEKYGAGLDERIKSLRGKVMKDKYYSGEMSPSHVLFAVLNSLPEYSAKAFTDATEVPGIDDISVFAEELPPMINRTGLMGNYFTVDDPITSGAVVQLHLPDNKGVGRRDNWTNFMKERFGFNESATDKKSVDAILSGVLVNAAVGLTGRDAVNVKGGYTNPSMMTAETIDTMIDLAMNSNYVHVDKNITKDTSVKHARSLVQIKNLIEAGKSKEAAEQIVMGENLHTIKRYNDIPYLPGDYIHFPDGIVGIVVRKLSEKEIEYVVHPILSTANVYKPTQRAVMSLEQIVEANNNRSALDGFVKTLSKAMPGVEYRYVHDEEAKEIQRSIHPSVSFYQDGIVYINIDKADAGVAIHEFAHPLMLTVQASNPVLFDAIAKAVAASPVMDYVRRMYGDELTTDAELIMEAIPTFIQMRYYARLRATQTAEERKLWDSFWNEIKMSFKELATGDINLDTSIDNINFAEAGLSAIGDAIINDMLRGKPLSEITTYELARMTPYTMRAATSSKVKNLSLKNIDRLFQKRGDNSDDGKIRRHLRRSISGTEYNGLSGTYDLSMRNKVFYDTAGNYSAEQRKNFIEGIIDNEMKLYDKIDERVVNFFYKLGDINPLNAARETIFASWDKRYDIANATDSEKVALENRVVSIINKVGFNPATDVALPMNKAMELLKVKLPTNVDGTGVIVFIHNYGKPNQQLSIMSVLPESLYAYGVGEHATLGAAFMGEGLTAKERRTNRKLKGVKLTNGNGDIETMKNSIIGMALKAIDPSINIRKVGAMRVTGSDITSYSREMEDIVPQVETLFTTIPQLGASLERDLYDVVMNKSLYNMELYKRPLYDRLTDYFQTLLMNEKEGTKFKQSLGRTLELAKQVYESHNYDSYTALQKAVYARIIHLRNDLDTDEMRANNDEYQQLLRMYRELTGYNEIGTNRIDQMSLDEKIIGTADRWSGQIRTWVFDQIDLGSRRAVEEMLPFQKAMDSKTKVLDVISGGILSFGADKAHDLFKPIFKTTKAIDAKTGQMVDVSTHEIHHDENDAETALALKQGTITKEQLEFGKWLANEMYEEFVTYVMTVERGSIATKVGATQEELRSAAIFEVDRRYKKGMMPVFVRSVGAAINDGSYSEAFKLYMKSASKWYGGNLYEEYYDSNSTDLQKDHFRKLLSPFWEQFTSSDNGGSDTRMKMMGLDYDRVGNLVLEEPMAQQSLSFNLQNIGNYAMLSSKRTKHLQMAVASVNVAMDMLRGENANGTNTKDIQEHIENYVNRQVYGNLPELPRVMVDGMSVSLDAAIGGTGKMINMIHLAVNVKLGAKNAVANGSKLIINALINSLTGKDFNLTAVSRAASELFSNPEKVKNLNEKYQLVQVTERDIINHWKYVHSKKNATETDMQMVVHWFGDYYSQLIGAMAQMMVEGTYDAHDAQGNYDPSQDKRFEGEDGAIIKQAIAEQQYKENYHVPEDGKMTHAYTQRGENAIKVHVQRFVGELNDSKYKNYISSWALTQAAMSLKNYVYNVAQAWWKNPSATVHLGKMGVREVNGTKEAVWVPEITEGFIQTLIYCTKGIAKAAKGDATMLKNMTPFQKRNLTSMSVFTAIVAGVYLLADMMLAGEEDDDKPKYEYYTDPTTGKREKKLVEPVWIGQRLMEMLYMTKYVQPKGDDLTMTEQLGKYVLIGAVNEQLSYVSPARPIQDVLVKGPYISQAENLGDLLWATISLPWTLTEDKNLVNATQEYGYLLSKNMPYGAPLRNGKEAFDGFINFLDTETTTK